MVQYGIVFALTEDFSKSSRVVESYNRVPFSALNPRRLETFQDNIEIAHPS